MKKEQEKAMGRRKITGEDYELVSSYPVIHADPEKDRIYLNYFVYRTGSGRAYEHALKLLGGEPDPWFLEDPDYWTECGRTECEQDIGHLRETAFSDRSMASCFAFCRLTGYSFPPPECDAYSHRIYSCEPVEGMNPEMIREFCGEMIEKEGPFAEEAKEVLKKLKSDQN